MSRKQRPPNGPGANGLRGGKNGYSLKTANGNWIEDCGGSSMYKRGFTCDSYETECQHQQIGRTLTKSPEFGANLPDRYIDPRTTNDVFNPPTGPQDINWQTNTQSMMKSSGARVLQTTNQVPKSNIDPVQLDIYRKSWTNDTPESRSMRFQTESRRAGNGSAPEKFAVKSVRYLPGTPIAFERFRERLIERFGILAMPNLRNLINNRSDLSSAEFYALVKASGISMARSETSSMLAYLTPADSFPSNKLLTIIRGSIDATEANTTGQSTYSALLYNLNDTAIDGASLPVEQLLLLLNSTKYPDVSSGLSNCINVYCNYDEISAEGFVLLCEDMYYSSSKDYFAVIKDLFGNL